MTGKRFIVIGRANAGKTLFIINFASFMGYNNITIKFKRNSDEISKLNSVEYFKKTLVDSRENTTKCLQVVGMEIPFIKGKKQVEFVDTTGLSAGINFSPEVREGMAQTLRLLLDSNIIFHIVDVSSVSAGKKIDEMDMELYHYGKKKGNYVLLINKMDLEESAVGLDIINSTMVGVRAFKISSLKKTGFDEVKKYVSKLA
jgi:Predicted GTPase